MNSYGQLTSRYLKGQWKRAFLTVIGIILSVALITGIGTMVVSFREYEINKVISDTGDYHVLYPEVPGALIPKIKNSVGVSRVGVIINEKDLVISKVSALERSATGEIPPYRYLKLKSYDRNSLKMFSVFLKEGRLPQKPGELVLDYWVLDYLPGALKLGDQIKLASGVRYAGNSDRPMEEYKLSSDEIFQQETEREFTIVGLITPRFESSHNYFANGITFLDHQQLTSKETYNVYVRLTSVRGVQERAEAIAQAFGLNHPIKYNNQLLRLSAQDQDSSLNQALTMVALFFTLLVIVCAVAVIYNAFHISVVERVSQFGLLRCVGATPGQIRRIVLKEAGILSLSGIPLGLVFGVLAMKLVIYLINSLGANALVFLKDLQVEASLPVLLLSSLLGLVTVYLSAMGPAKQAAKISPLEAIRNTGSDQKEAFKKVKQARLLQWIFGIEGQIAGKNLRRKKKRFQITVFSMIISIVLYIVFSYFFNSLFRIGAVEGGVDADFLLSIKKGEQASFSAEQYVEIKNLPGVEYVYKNKSTDVALRVSEKKVNPRFAELKGELLEKKEAGMILYPAGKLVSYGEALLPKIEETLQGYNLASMNQENGIILISTNMLYDSVGKKRVIVEAFDYQVGDGIQLSIQSSGEVEKNNPQLMTVKVMGISENTFLDDGYTEDGQVYLFTTDYVYQKLTGNQDYRQMAIRLEENANPEAVVKYLKNLTVQNPSYEYLDISNYVEKLRNAALTTKIFFYGFIAVVALIGSLNIINTISTNLILRSREFAMLKAIGMTQAGINKLVCLESTLYGLIAAIYGGIIGSAFTYLLSKIITQAGIEYTWGIPWSQILTAVLGAILLALFSGYIPLKRINQGVMIEKIRIEE